MTDDMDCGATITEAKASSEEAVYISLYHMHQQEHQNCRFTRIRVMVEGERSNENRGVGLISLTSGKRKAPCTRFRQPITATH
jgi:hypothetical protein